jgi:hypothetical protein
MPARTDFSQQGSFDGASRHGFGTARMEMAAWRRGERRGNLTSDRHKGTMLSVDPGNFLEQGLRVGMIRRGK